MLRRSLHQLFPEMLVKLPVWCGLSGADNDQLAAGHDIKLAILRAHCGNDVCWRRLDELSCPARRVRTDIHRFARAIEPPEVAIGRIGFRAYEQCIELRLRDDAGSIRRDAAV